MQESRKLASFLLPGKEALKGNWYFEFRDKLKEFKVKLFGYENLKQLKINPNKPVTKLQITSGIDWFDTIVDVSFGAEQVELNAIKKAMAKKQNFVALKDGSLGLLPQDWMDKYAMLVKLGTTTGKNGLRLKKFHFSALENMKSEIREEEILDHLNEKREKLMAFDFDKQANITLPENIYADLRPYQLAGFQWMSFLKETGWGGILADDMGLGKTLQALSILQHYLNEHPDALFLVACPTTLIYNWENEIRKYTPDIKFITHHGPQRSKDPQQFNGFNLIITTYGTLRSDIKMLSALNLDYTVLDESQTIKNPLSQVAKASLQLQSKNRLALSGTPVQNNTFDLFAQMNFLNPGMLGSMEFFRNEFANPIDKMQEQEAKENLRKLINPFLLRRTKEQVAPDLPEKTEMILFCEMGAQQRKIYEAYKNSFRSKILGEIDEKGLGNVQLSVLTGLMKLRQICDSPAILKETDKFDNHSVKIQELVRGLTENTGNHKALVFSQFLGMLSLIRAELDKLNIPYVYFDGATSSAEREKAIQAFQNNEECRVFLISLKAGGVGLNLTAADYVYIVDPWWNPAVEQQAIDRTHRIGQTKNIFAYRLICKDTIEEKILLLQERKLSLVKDLISEENAFLKKLTKEDIAYLLS
jgi:non-specific serine/threonine protein kinase